MRRCGMQKMKFLSILVSAILITALMTSIAYAYAAYHGNWSEQPYWGNWWWYNYSYLYWDVDDLWTPSGVNALRSGHNNFPWKEYRFEQEAYNPGLGTSCDRLKVYAVYAGQPPTWNLPITSYSILNGCGSSAIKELVHFELDENSISANVWYRHRVVYQKQNPGSGGDGEVNYSFTHNWTWSDSWLGKVVYDRWFNKKYSDPSGLVN
jgi:hypothetical protein